MWNQTWYQTLGSLPYAPTFTVKEEFVRDAYLNGITKEQFDKAKALYKIRTYTTPLIVKVNSKKT